MELSPKEKAKDLVLQMIKVDKKINKYPMSIDLAIDLSLLCVGEIQRFGNSIKTREPMMYWGIVSKELKKMKTNFY